MTTTSLSDVAPRSINVLSLCSGVGGLDLAVGLACPGARVVCYVEGEAYGASVLTARMEEGSLDPAPIWSDLRSFDGRRWRGVVDLVTCGWPCQPASVAGARAGDSDARWLWDDVVRILDEVQPRWFFGENVAGLRTVPCGPALRAHAVEVGGHSPAEAVVWSGLHTGSLGS